MPNFCPNCGNKIQGNPRFCSNCGHTLIVEERKPVNQTKTNILPPEAESIIDLNKIAGIFALIFGIIFIIIGVITLIFFVGIIFIVFGIIDIVIKIELDEINSLIKNKRYREAKDKELVWVILGFILGGLIIGIIALIAYIKYDDLLRKANIGY